MVDTLVSGISARNGIGVQIPSRVKKEDEKSFANISLKFIANLSTFYGLFISPLQNIRNS